MRRMDASTKKSVVRRTLVWMAVAALSMGGALAFEHDSGASGVLLDQSTLTANDGTCTGGHGETKPDCEPCPNNPNKNCHKPCTEGNGSPKKDCVPCGPNNKDGEPHDCHPSCQK